MHDSCSTNNSLEKFLSLHLYVVIGSTRKEFSFILREWNPQQNTESGRGEKENRSNGRCEKENRPNLSAGGLMSSMVGGKVSSSRKVFGAPCASFASSTETTTDHSQIRNKSFLDFNEPLESLAEVLHAEFKLLGHCSIEMVVLKPYINGSVALVTVFPHSLESYTALITYLDEMYERSGEDDVDLEKNKDTVEIHKVAGEAELEVDEEKLAAEKLAKEFRRKSRNYPDLDSNFGFSVIRSVRLNTVKANRDDYEIYTVLEKDVKSKKSVFVERKISGSFFNVDIYSRTYRSGSTSKLPLDAQSVLSDLGYKARFMVVLSVDVLVEELFRVVYHLAKRNRIFIHRNLELAVMKGSIALFENESDYGVSQLNPGPFADTHVWLDSTYFPKEYRLKPCEYELCVRKVQLSGRLDGAEIAGSYKQTYGDLEKLNDYDPKYRAVSKYQQVFDTYAGALGVKLELIYLKVGALSPVRPHGGPGSKSGPEPELLGQSLMLQKSFGQEEDPKTLRVAVAPDEPFPNRDRFVLEEKSFEKKEVKEAEVKKKEVKEMDVKGMDVKVIHSEDLLHHFSENSSFYS